MNQPVYLAAGSRTAFVRAGTVFNEQTPLSLSAHVLRHMSDEARPDLISWGQVIPSTEYSNIAREAALDAGVDARVPAYSTQLACATSMASALQLSGLVGKSGIELAIVGGVEQMGRIPVALTDEAAARLVAAAHSDPAALPKAFKSLVPGDFKFPTKGWTNRISGRSMGEHMEETAQALGIDRAPQDALAHASHRNASEARIRGFFDDLILPLDGVSKDGFVRDDSSVDKLAALRPVFDPQKGSLTAGNSSPLTDGAAALWVASGDGLERLGDSRPAARLVDFMFGAVDFDDDGMLMAPAYLIPELLQRHGLQFEDISLWEIHEAFAAQVLANVRVAARQSKLGDFPWQRLNPNGGSLALGHPFAATGARILSQTVFELSGMPSGSRAMVSICADGGQGTVALLEAL